MRPKSVIQAERVYLLATAILLATSIMAWDELSAAYGQGLTSSITAFMVGLFLLLILLTTRRGSRVALWLLVAVTAIGAVSLAAQIASGALAIGTLGVLNALQVVLTVVGAVLLFRPNARAWFAGRARPPLELDA